MKQIIQSTKKIQQYTVSSVAIGTKTNITCLKAEQDYTGSVNRCPVGAVVKAVYVELWLLGVDQQPGSFVCSIEKDEGGKSNMDYTDSISLDTYTNKKNLFKITQGLIGDANANPTPIFREWILIPKGKQRMGLGDEVKINLSAITNDLQYCGMNIVIFRQ